MWGWKADVGWGIGHIKVSKSSAGFQRFKRKKLIYQVPDLVYQISNLSVELFATISALLSRSIH
jgi:hypothetical protein